MGVEWAADCFKIEILNVNWSLGYVCIERF